MTRILASLPAAALVALLVPPTAMAQDNTGTPASAASVTLQLNKLEDTGGNCRAYFIVDNQLPEPLSTLSLDTFIFDADGVISNRVALTFDRIRASREKVALFEFATACSGISRFLINEVMACEAVSGPSEACVTGLGTTSKAGAALDY